MYQIQKYQKSPVVYIITSPNLSESIYISLSTYFYFSFKENTSYTNLKITDILRIEEEHLTMKLMNICAKSEKNVQFCTEWLKKRYCSKSMVSRILEQLKEKKYIEHSRYIENFLRDQERRGNKPLWLLLKELKYKKGLEIPHDNIEYDEVLALKNYIPTLGRFKEDKKKITQFLIKKGFSINTIKKALSNEDSSN